MFETEVINNARYKLNNFLSTEKTADFSLSRLGNGIKEFVNDYKWPLVGIGAAGLGLAGLNYSLNKDLEAYEKAPKYADPRYMNEDGSLLPSFTTIRPLQNENIEHLEELIDEKALNKFFANNFNRFNYVKNQDGTYSHVGNTPEWEDGADIYDAYEEEISGKGGPGRWGYLNDDELPSIEDAKALGFLNHLISTEPYYEGQKSISKTASLKTADFKTRFGQDLGGFLSHMAYGGVGGALLGGLYHDIAGGTPDDLVSDMNTGMNIGAALSGLYGGINTHIGMNDRIKRLGDLLAKRFTSGVSPDYQVRTDKLKNMVNNLTNGGFMAGLKEVF